MKIMIMKLYIFLLHCSSLKEKIMASNEIMEQTKVKSKKLGGLRTMPCIITNEALEKVASIGLQANMIMYLIYEYHLEVANGATILFLWTFLSCLTPIMGAFLSDSWLGRFRVITFGTITSLLGIIILWFTAIFPKTRPSYCDIKSGEKCASPNPAQMLLLYVSFGLMSLGSGGIKPCSMAFAADQMEDPENPKNESVTQSFFNWYYASVGVSVIVAVTVMVYIQENFGWIVGYGVSAGVMLMSTISFLLGSSIYVKVPPNKKLSAGFLQVIYVAWKKIHVNLLQPSSFDGWCSLNGSRLVTPTNKLRFLNKACMITNAEKELDPDGLAKDPWSLCTVRQVEELKALINVLPIWSTGIMIGAIMSQGSFPVVIAGTMDRHIFPNIILPAASFSIFGILTLTIWVVIYNQFLVPLISNYTKRPRGLSCKQRIGAGLALSCLATAVAAEVERHRRSIAIKEGYANNAHGVVTMSARWLVPQQCLNGLAEAFNAIGQIEFYYSQLPKSMASIAMSLPSVGFGIGSLVGSLILTVVNNVSKKWGVSWVSSNINQGHYDFYYWVLTVMRVVNILYFLLCSWAYGSEVKTIWDDENKKEERCSTQESMQFCLLLSLASCHGEKKMSTI